MTSMFWKTCDVLLQCGPHKSYGMFHADFNVFLDQTFYIWKASVLSALEHEQPFHLVSFPSVFANIKYDVMYVCSLQNCGHLPGKGLTLGSLVFDVFLCFCHFSMWCPVSGVVLDCIDSWSLPSSLLL